jgi:CHAT domain-containing protein
VLRGFDSVRDGAQLFASLVEAGAPADSLGRALGAAFLAPALAGLPATVHRLVIVPDGALHSVPFDAIRGADGRPLLERFSIAEVPSAAVAVRLWSRVRPRSAPAILAFGNPRTTGLPPLPAAASEARALSRYSSDAHVWLDAAASEARLKRDAQARYAVVHFAAHALVDDDAVDRTALALAAGDGEDGDVSPDEVAGLRLDADLVVLSGCRTARGLFVSGEGVQGLTAPFLAAGARAVVASRWRVGDERTSTFMRAFYAGLADGHEVGDALRLAKLRARRDGGGPEEWAAFTVIGDPFARPALRRALPPVVIWAAIGLVLVALGYVVTRKGTGATIRSVPSANRAWMSQ